MLDLGLRLMTSMALSGAGILVESGRMVAGDDAFDVRPGQFRRLLLTFEESVQGRIPEILGDDEEERVDTLVRLLRGTSEREMAELLSSLQVALERLAEENEAGDRRTRRARSGRRGAYPPAPEEAAAIDAWKRRS